MDEAKLKGGRHMKRERKDLTYCVSIPQDPSVGVPDIIFDVTIHDFTMEQMIDGVNNGKAEFRKALEEFWGKWFDGKTKIFFDDEADFDY